MTPCSFPDCARKHKAIGLCAPHWTQNKRGEPLRPVRARGPNKLPNPNIAQNPPCVTHGTPKEIRIKSGWRCRQCHADREHNRKWRKLLGATDAEVSALLARSGGKCEICGNRPSGRGRNRVLHIDHDHVTGKVRGLLCMHCNTGLGLFREDRERLAAASEYIRRWIGT